MKSVVGTVWGWVVAVLAAPAGHSTHVTPLGVGHHGKGAK